MTSTMLTLLALSISAAALTFLSHTDAKRRRTYKLPAYEAPQKRKWAWCMVFSPLPILMIHGHWPAFIMWLAGISLVGWGLAVRKPRFSNDKV